MIRRDFLRGGVACAGLALPSSSVRGHASDSSGAKVFRWALPAAETGFDPAQVSDLYSGYVIANIIEAPLQYDYLARPTMLKPRTAALMPVVASDYRTFTVRIRPGIFFQDDPAFKGVRRELVAADYVYQLKRIADARWKSPSWSAVETALVIGLADLRRQAAAGARFDYDREIEGIRTLDRYTFQVKLEQPSPRFLENFADARPFGGVAREVVEAYPEQIMSKPVGTGPFRLVRWQRSTRMVLERNPAFRDEFYDGSPSPGDARGQALLARLRGKKLPLIDRVELSVITESQPRWLSFLNGEQEAINVPLEFINSAVPNGRLAPSLARQNVQFERTIQPDIVLTYFNLDEPVVGGYAPGKVALRRAVSLGYDVEEEIRLIRRGSMAPAQSPVPPLTSGYDPGFVSEMGQFDRARARALLDIYGYVDRDGDGWREMPDGSRLELVIATESAQIDRAFNEMWKRQLDALGLRVTFQVSQWPEHLKAARAGRLMMWFLGSTAAGSDSDAFLALAATSGIGASNFARFSNATYDRLYERQRHLPDGPERDGVIFEMKRLFTAYMPYKVHGHRFANDLSQPWLIGYRRHPFARDFFKYIDIDRGQTRTA
ncbi:MAG TPA: ABC transporter substrate-binding protein [Burkholderiaceae bacterium]|nr:ABC transporter substrate-binding protein [Burkholderiaceae bacterium]